MASSALRTTRSEASVTASPSKPARSGLRRVGEEEEEPPGALSFSSRRS
jgi:hypothetical protein